MTRVFGVLFFVVLLTTSCSTPRTDTTGRFSEQEEANLIVRYYSDDTIYVLKPQATEGPFLSVFRKDAVVDLALQQPSRELAVVILIPYEAESQSEAVRENWRGLLTKAGYQRVVFLRSLGGMKVNGLPVLASGG